MIRRVVLVSLALLHPSLASALDITTCGQTVPRGQVGELRADLDCSGGAFAAGVTLEDRATLRLNGHRVNGPVTGSHVIHAIGRKGKVVGPGEVHTSDLGCIGTDTGSLTVEGGTGIDVHGCLQALDGKNLRASNVTVHDNSDFGLVGLNVRAEDVVVQRSGRGIHAAGRVVIENGSVSDNDVYGITAATSVVVEGATITDNRIGVRGRAIAIRGASITGNGVVGAEAAKQIRVLSSTVTGNGVAPEGSIPPGTDLYSAAGRIGVRDSSCGKSGSPNGPLGVCADD
jgi:hypothetical protein